MSSRGNAFVLVIALVLVARQPARVLAVVGALVAAMVRWGTTSLGAIAGAQAVLGPAGWTGSSGAVASAWIGAAALVRATPSGVGALPFGLAAALVAVGPGPGGAIALRVIASIVAVLLCIAIAIVTERRRDVRRTANAVNGRRLLGAAVAAAVVLAGGAVVAQADLASGSYTDAIAIAIAGGAIWSVGARLVRSRAL